MRNKMTEQPNNIPFQVESLIQNMLNKGERVHIRGNYRERLQSIRDAIDKALRIYDNETYMSRPKKWKE